MKKITFLIIAVLLVSTLVLNGCIQSGATTTPDTTSTSTRPVLANGVLNLSDIDPITLDPAVSSDIGSAAYIMQIYSGLLQLDDKLQPSANIAQTWDTSSDGLTYTFNLRPDVKFQNGKALTAADFKYSWERAASPATGSQTAGTYLGDIVGVKDMLAGKASSISGVKVIDDYKLQVTIDSPKSYFLDKLTYPTAYAVDKNNVSSGPNWWQKPNGTGPFKLSQWTPGQSLTLVSNDSYYGTKPQLSQVNYQYYTGAPMDLYETGKIDVAAISLSYIDEVMDKSGPYFQQLSVTPQLSFSYVGFNCAKPPFDDPNIRMAFSLAIDKDKIVSVAYRNMVQKADGILPPGLPGYNQNVTGVGFNVDKAKELIKASKYGDVSRLPPITYTTQGYGGAVGSTVQALVYQWKQNLGVDVQVRQLEPERYFYTLKSEADQMFDTGWVADYPHPQDFLDVLFRSGSDNNYGNFSDPKVDSLLQQANQTLNPEQSYTLYQQAEQLIVNDAACLPLSFGKNYTLTKPYVHGYTDSSLGIAMLNRVSISPR